MRKSARVIIGVSASVLLLGALIATPTLAQKHTAGAVPDARVCNDKDNPPKDAVTQGGCVVLERTKGKLHGLPRDRRDARGQHRPATRRHEVTLPGQSQTARSDQRRTQVQSSEHHAAVRTA